MWWGLGFILLLGLSLGHSQFNNSCDGEDADNPPNRLSHSQPALDGSQSYDASAPPFQSLENDPNQNAGWISQVSGVDAQLSPGMRQGSQRFHVNDGYYFHRQRAAGARIFLRCVQSRSNPPCAARASVNHDLSGFIPLGPHNHGPDVYHERVQQLRERLLEACRARPNARIDVIYHEVCRNSLREVSSRVSLVSMRPSMVRVQSENRPNIPHSFEEFDLILQENFNLRHTHDREDLLYRGITGVHGHRSMIFMSNRVIEGIGPVRYLFCDATFYARPNLPDSAQLYTIVTIRDNHVVPILHALMESRTEQAYMELLNFFRQLAPNIDPDCLISDFEVAQQHALHVVFPMSRIAGCYWHYARALCRNVRSLGLQPLVRDNENARRIVRLSTAIPLVPAGRVQEGLNCVIIESRRLALYDQFQEFFNYIRQTWIVGVGANALSVFGIRHRTNNVAECHHRNINSRLVRRPNIWRFLELLSEIEDIAWRDLGRLEQGLAPSRARRASSLLNDARIRSCSRQVMHREMEMLQFLSSVSWHMDSTVRDILMEREVPNRPQSPERGAPQQPAQQDSQVFPQYRNSMNDLCPENDLEFPQRNGGDDNSRIHDECYEADRFHDLMESDEDYPIRGRGAGRGRPRGRRTTGRSRPSQAAPDRHVPPSSRIPANQVPASRPRQPVRMPFHDSQATAAAPQPSPFRNLDFLDDGLVPENQSVAMRRWTECIVCYARVGRYTILGCGAFPVCWYCVREWFVRRGMNNCPHCNNPSRGWLRLDF